MNTRSATAPANRQHTLKSAIQCRGIGLHSGACVSLTLHPAAANSGIVFRCQPGLQSVTIPAHWRQVVDTSYCTVIGDGDGTTVGTIEHLMAALAGCAIDNVVIELDGPEVPAMDGSSAPFVFLIECAGRAAQDATRRFIQVTTPIEVSGDGKSIAIAPAADLSIDMTIEFDEPVIGRQDISFVLHEGSFKSHLACARTFGFDHEVSRMRAAGLALGGSFKNAVVLGGDGVLNDEGLRFPDEFVRHKALDCLGDLYLAGAPLLGAVAGWRSGHAMNHALLERLFASDNAWQVVTPPTTRQMERTYATALQTASASR